MFESITKGPALMTIKNFKEGIRLNSFRLEKLTDGTIRRKRQLGMERPRTPLYGRGDDVKDRSYINMLRMRKLINGHKVFVSVAMHHSGAIRLRDLFVVHEFGTIIKGAHGQFIRIPARPAFKKAQQRTLRQMKAREPSGSDVKRAINQIINTGNTGATLKIIDRIEEGLKKFEATD